MLEFLRLASERQIAFKATAGLHHCLRSMQHLTYKEGSPQAMMHGFLNLFCAAVLLWHERERRQEAAWMLSERDADAITMDEMTMTWHNSGVTFAAEQIAEARERFCISFGSCSFTEPGSRPPLRGYRFDTAFSFAHCRACEGKPTLFRPLPADACLSSIRRFADRVELKPSNGHLCSQYPC